MIYFRVQFPAPPFAIIFSQRITTMTTEDQSIQNVEECHKIVEAAWDNFEEKVYRGLTLQPAVKRELKICFFSGMYWANSHRSQLTPFSPPEVVEAVAISLGHKANFNANSNETEEALRAENKEAGEAKTGKTKASDS